MAFWERALPRCAPSPKNAVADSLMLQRSTGKPRISRKPQPFSTSSLTRALSVRPNATKARLAAGETVYGCFIRYPDPGLAELVALQGFDFLVLDGEHGTMEPRECENMVRGAEVRDVTPLVRVPANDGPVILRFLDTGAQGVAS